VRNTAINITSQTVKLTGMDWFLVRKKKYEMRVGSFIEIEID